MVTTLFSTVFTKKSTQIGLLLGSLCLIIFVAIGCGEQEATAFELTAPIDYHEGYWVAKMDVEERPVAITVVNDMHIDAETNSVTVYAQSRISGRILAPPQVGPGECEEGVDGETVCFHPDAVYLNGSGEELSEADGTGEWWVKHAWILDGEGYDNCELRPQKEYNDCMYAEGVLMEDGLSMKVGIVELGLEGFFNIRTPLLDEDPIRYKVTRFAPKNLDETVGEVDLTPTQQWELIWECEEEKSAFDNRARECPKLQDS